MKLRLAACFLTAQAALMVLVAGSAFAEMNLGGYKLEGSAEAGGFAQPVPYTDVAKFQEYRDLAQQIIAPQLQFLLGDQEDRYYVDFNALNLAQTNEVYNLRFGAYGLLDVQAQWREIPDFLSDDVARTPYQQDGGNFTLTSRPPPPIPGQPPGQNLHQWLNTNAHPLDLSLLRGVANLNIRYTPTPDWTYTATFNFQNPSGNRPLGALFGPTPTVYNITEILQPIEYDIYNYGVGAEYARDGWLLGFKYDGSFFRNQYDTVTWQNPDTWNNPATPLGACVNTGLYAPAAGLGPCGGIRAMFPDNEAHNFTINGSVALPLNTQLTASGSYGWWLQNDPFVPFTNNTALPYQRLPRRSLGGDVQPAFVNASLVSRPVEKLDLKATYSYFNYDNQTPTIHFTNVLSMNDVASLWNATAYPFSFSTQDVNLQASYQLTEDLAARFVGDISTYHNAGLMVLQQDKTSYGPILDYTPRPWLELRTSYQHAFRDSPGYDNNRATLLAQNAGNSELADMRRFDQATVEVNQFSIYGQTQPFEDSKNKLLKDLTLYTEMDYDDYNFSSSDIGVTHWSSYSPSVGVSYSPTRDIRVFSNYSWQADDWSLSSFQRQPFFGPPPAPGGPHCPPDGTLQTPANCPGRVWSGVSRDQGSSVDFGVDVTIPHTPLLKNKSHLQLQYTYTTGSDVTHAHGDVLTPATNFPSWNTQFHELVINYQYMVRKNVALNIGYYFSHFGENDFGFDNLNPWMGSAAPDSMFLGDSAWQPYSANVGYVTLKVSF